MTATAKQPTNGADILPANTNGHPLGSITRDPQPKSISQNAIALSQPNNKQRQSGTLVSHNVVINGHRTSMRLEPEMWAGLKEICQRERVHIHQICTSVSLEKPSDASLTSSIRVFIMRYFRDAATEDGHRKSNHGAGLPFGIGMNVAQSYHNNRLAATLTETSFA